MASRAITGRDVLNDVVHRGDNAGTICGAVIAEDLQGEDAGLLGDAVVARGDQTRGPGAVAGAVTVVSVVSEVHQPLCTALELLMVDFDTSINDVLLYVSSYFRVVFSVEETYHTGSLASGAVVGVVRGAVGSVRNAGDSPGGILLREVLEHADDLVLLDILDLYACKSECSTRCIKD